MEWKLGEHGFAYFLFLLLFFAVGAIILFLLDIFEVRGINAYLMFFFLMTVMFAPIAKYWRSKFLNKRKKH